MENIKKRPMKVIIRNSQKQIKADLPDLKKTALILLRSFNFQGAELGILLVNDRRMKQLNALYRGIPRTTDVLSFPMYHSLREIPCKPGVLLGDIVISPKRALMQAAEYGCSLNEEFHRLIIHGFLHLLGYDHEKNPYQDRKMKKKEKELLNALEAVD